MPQTGSQPSASVAAVRLRAEVIWRIRRYFREHNILEVDTPLVSHAWAENAGIDPFIIRYHASDVTNCAASQTLYLQSAPDLHMKRLLAAGFPDMFQIGKSFRDGERGVHHNPEFTLLKWYRRGFTIFLLMDEVVKICRLVLGEMVVRQLTYRQMWLEAIELDPIEAHIDDLNCFAVRLDPSLEPFEERADAFKFITAMAVEPRLPADQLLCVYDYPLECSTLAEATPHDSRLAARFECYYRRVKLCNGYAELTDSSEVHSRLRNEYRRRTAAGKPVVVPPESARDVLIRDLPGCAGVALGIERLVMLAGDFHSIDDVVAFPFEQS